MSLGFDRAVVWIRFFQRHCHTFICILNDDGSWVDWVVSRPSEASFEKSSTKVVLKKKRKSLSPLCEDKPDDYFSALFSFEVLLRTCSDENRCPLSTCSICSTDISLWIITNLVRDKNNETEEIVFHSSVGKLCF